MVAARPCSLRDLRRGPALHGGVHGHAPIVLGRAARRSIPAQSRFAEHGPRVARQPLPVPDPIRLHFDRGTLRLDGAGAETLPTVVWDERVAGWRAPAHRYASIVAHAASTGLVLRDEVAPHLRTSTGPWNVPQLRSYQSDALHAWRAFRSRGLVALPTGSGKTIVAVAALAGACCPALVLCPTRALLEQWERVLRRSYGGSIGVVGD